jgi:hypothetical protein
MQSIDLSLEDALQTAREYVWEHAGIEALDGLELNQSGLVFVMDSGWAEYEFSWSNPPDKNGVVLGRRSFSVNVNPSTGLVRSYNRIEHPVALPPKISPLRCRELVTEFLQEQNTKGVITRLAYGEIRGNGKISPYWTVSWHPVKNRNVIGPMTSPAPDILINAITASIGFFSIEAFEALENGDFQPVPRKNPKSGGDTTEK